MLYRILAISTILVLLAFGCSDSSTDPVTGDDICFQNIWFSVRLDGDEEEIPE